MKIAGADNQNGSTEPQRPGVPKIDSNQFQPSFAVAQLAVKLCELKKAQSTIPLEKENLEPKDFLKEAWELIQRAGEHMLPDWSHEAAERWFGRILTASRVTFKKLCDPERNKGDTETIVLPDPETGKTIEVDWKVRRSEREFDNLFWVYWTDCGEQWTEWMKGEKPRTPWMKRDAVTFSKLVHNKRKYPGGFKQLWKERGQSVLASWKIGGVPPTHFLALASGYFDFERGVKVITGENRFDRALPSFRRFLKSRFADEGMAERDRPSDRKARRLAERVRIDSEIVMPGFEQEVRNLLDRRFSCSALSNIPIYRPDVREDSHTLATCFEMV
jgi:hypothetical protein